MTERLHSMYRIVAALHQARDEDFVAASREFCAAEEDGRAILQDLLRICSLFYGFPRIVRALTQVHQELGKLEPSSVVAIPEDPLIKGEELFREVYGRDAEPVLQHLQRVDPHYRAWVLRHAYGTAFATTCLSLEERERLSVMGLCATGCWQQARSHMRACLRHGVATSVLLADLESVDWLSREARDLATTCIHAEAELG
ncbi:MAG: carboxymuconolactone decarboxylase family protein [Planctomycetota bacterium]|jgi:alkylhydroperoxidase/carboxymuconolactone decarboxylase family protein YurZ